MKCILVRRMRFFFAEGPLSAGLDRASPGREGPPGLTPNGAVTIGCTRGAEEGTPHSSPSGAEPSLGLSAHAARATGSRRRKTSVRWMVGFAIGDVKPLTGNKRLRGDHTRARGSRPVGLVPREGRVTTEHKTRRGLRPSSRCGDRGSWECSYVAILQVAEVDRRPLLVP